MAAPGDRRRPSGVGQPGLVDFDTLVRETMKVSDKSPSEFEQFKAGTIADLEERGLR